MNQNIRETNLYGRSGSVSQSQAPQVTLQLEQSDFDLLVRDRDTQDTHFSSTSHQDSRRQPVSSRNSRDAIPRTLLEPHEPAGFMSSSEEPNDTLSSISRSGFIRRSSVPTPPLLPPIIPAHSNIIDLISDFDSVTGSNAPQTSSRPVETIPTPPVRPRAPSPLANVRHEGGYRRSPTIPGFAPSPRVLNRLQELQHRLLTSSSRASNSHPVPISMPTAGRLPLTASASNRSPELPPIAISDGLDTLSSILSLDGHRSEPFLSRQYVPSPLTTLTTAASSDSSNQQNQQNSQYTAQRNRMQVFEEAIAQIRSEPSTIPRTVEPPVLPHPFESSEGTLRRSATSRSGGHVHSSAVPSDGYTSTYRQQSFSNRQSIPTLPPIFSAPLLDGDNPTNDLLDLDRFSEDSWEEEERPSEWLVEARRALNRHRSLPRGRRAVSASPRPPVLELPNFSSASLGLGDSAPSSPVPSARTRPSVESLRRNWLSRRMQGASNDRDASAQPLSPSSLLEQDEPFDTSVWRELEGVIQNSDAASSNLGTRGSSASSRPTWSRQASDYHGYSTDRGPSRLHSHPSSFPYDTGHSRLAPRTTLRRQASDMELEPLRDHLHQVMEGSIAPHNIPALDLNPLPGPSRTSAFSSRPASAHSLGSLNRRRATDDDHILGPQRNHMVTRELLLYPEERNEFYNTRASGQRRLPSLDRGDQVRPWMSDNRPRPLRAARPTNLTTGFEDSFWIVEDLLATSSPSEASLTTDFRLPAWFTRHERTGVRVSRSANGDYVSDIYFDSSYEALIDLAEQVGTVPRGVPDALSSFISAQAKPFGEMDPSLLTRSPIPSTLPITARLSATASTKPSCTICLDEYSKKDMCVTLTCAHFFHQTCVMEWLRAAPTCPLCRHPISAPSAS